MNFAQELFKVACPKLAITQPDNRQTQSSSSSQPIQSPSPSTSPTLPKRENFYQIFEKHILTELLQATTIILRETEFQQDHNKDKIDNAYNTFYNFMSVMSLENLCEGLRLTEEQSETLVCRIATRTAGSYSPDLLMFAATRAMQRCTTYCSLAAQNAEILKDEGR